jgi:hypothetical protein
MIHYKRFQILVLGKELKIEFYLVIRGYPFMRHGIWLLIIAAMTM